VFVGSIQPCFDKKLEFFRPETHINEKKTMDIVLTTSEVKDLIEQNRNMFDQIELDPNEVFCYNFQDMFSNFIEKYKENVILSEDMLKTQNIKDFDFSVNSTTNSTSNNYIYSILSILDKNLTESQIQYTEKKKGEPNFVEAKFEAFDGKKTIKVAKVYGFKNIQKLTRQFKSKTCNYDFVEVMACPGGCLNGGGQIKIADKKPRDVLKVLEDRLHSNKLALTRDNQLARSLCEEIA